MQAPKCPYCGSKYTIDKGVEESISKSEHNYFCQACKRSFHIDTDKSTAQGDWLMTFYDSSDFLPEYIEVYLTDQNKISVNQRYLGDGVKYFSGKKNISLSVTHNSEIPDKYGSYFLQVSTFSNPFDETGGLFSVERIEMNPKLKNIAMGNEAMKIVWNGSEFNLKDNEFKEIITDIRDFLVDLLNSQGARGVSATSGACYVATAVYGSYDCPEVWTLRRYRDFTLAKTAWGRAFIHTYYAVSPTFVKWFGNQEWFQNFWRNKLDHMIAKLRKEGFSDEPYDDRSW